MYSVSTALIPYTKPMTPTEFVEIEGERWLSYIALRSIQHPMQNLIKINLNSVLVSLPQSQSTGTSLDFLKRMPTI